MLAAVAVGAACRAESAAAHLSALVTSGKGAVRWAAVGALGMLGERGATGAPAILDFVQSGRSMINIGHGYRAVTAMGTAHPDLVMRLVELAASARRFYFHRAVDVAKQVMPRSEAMVARLVDQLEDEDAEICEAVCVLLAELGPLAASAAPSVKELTDETDQRLRKAAIAALESLHGS